jgi:roadblock/LC7 domain-containing protein
MTELNNLMALDGAVAAFEFSDSGELKSHQLADGSGMTEQTLDMLSHVCVANLSIATMQARGWESLTGMGGFYPIGGFTLMGVDWSAVVQGTKGVVLENNKANYEAAYQALAE